jgi:hypothetical protein
MSVKCRVAEDDQSMKINRAARTLKCTIHFSRIALQHSCTNMNFIQCKQKQVTVTTIPTTWDTLFHIGMTCEKYTH